MASLAQGTTKEDPVEQSVLERQDAAEETSAKAGQESEAVQASPDGGVLNPNGDRDHQPAPEQPASPELHLPVETLREALPYLRRPFTKEAVRWKVQSAFGDKGCLVVGYIDARLVVERLNLVIPDWEDHYEPLPSELMLCLLTVGGTTREDVGSGYKGKGLYSDALKRAAVKFGIGVSVYAIPRAELWRSEQKHKGLFTYKLVERQGKPKQHVYTLTVAGEEKLRERYEKWLELRGIPAFGEPIDHGDVEDSAGEEPEAAAAESDVSDLPAHALPLVDQEADELRMAARTAYDALAKLKGGKKALTPAAFHANLVQASTSHDDLRALIERVNGLGSEISA